MRVLFLTVLYPLLSLSSFINPYYGVLSYLFISVIRPEQLNHGRPPFSGVFAIAIACLVLSCLLRRENLLGAFRTPFFKMVLLFLGGLYLSTALSDYTDSSLPRGSYYYLNMLPQTMVFCVCLYAVLTRLGEKEIQRLLKLLVFSFLFMALWGVEQYFRGNTLVEQLFGAAIIDRCAITGVFVLYLPLTLYYASKKERMQKVFGICSFFAFATMVVLTQSRAGFLGLCVALLTVFYFSARKKVFVAATVSVLLVSLPFVPDVYWDRIGAIKGQDIEGDEITDYSSASRLLLWRAGLDIFERHPLLGVGNQNFSKAAVGFSRTVAGTIDERLFTTTFGQKGRGGLSHTHNTFLNILVEGGVLAAVPYYLVIALPIWGGFKLYRGAKRSGAGNADAVILVNLLNAGLLGYLVTAFFSNLIFIDYMYWNLTLSYFLSRRCLESAARQTDERVQQMAKGAVTA